MHSCYIRTVNEIFKIHSGGVISNGGGSKALINKLNFAVEAQNAGSSNIAIIFYLETLSRTAFTCVYRII